MEPKSIDSWSSQSSDSQLILQPPTLTRRLLAMPGDNFQLSQPGGGVESRDSAKLCIMHQMVTTTKHHLAQNANDADLEKAQITADFNKFTVRLCPRFPYTHEVLCEVRICSFFRYSLMYKISIRRICPKGFPMAGMPRQHLLCF